MIESISFADLKTSSQFSYAAELPLFKRRRGKALRFHPGLNIVFGPNASGKSTLLSMIGDALAARQGGYSCVTETALRARMSAIGEPLPAGYFLRHDGKPIMYFDSRSTPGVVGGKLDDDFMHLGLSALHGGSVSAGEGILQQLGPIFDVLIGRQPYPSSVQYKVNRKMLNDTWKKAFDMQEALLRATCEAGPSTIVLDEPDSHLSIANRARLWDFLERAGEDFQIIVATHCPFALGRTAQYIETGDGFIRESLVTAAKHFERINGLLAS